MYVPYSPLSLLTHLLSPIVSLLSQLPEGWMDKLPSYELGTKDATLDSSGKALNALADIMAEMVGGSAELTPG